MIAKTDIANRDNSAAISGCERRLVSCLPNHQPTPKMRYDNIIPAVPGSMIIWYNHCHDSTQSSPILFWGVCHEVGDTTPFVKPFTIDAIGAQASPFELPQMEYTETDPRHRRESRIIAMEIPGWGRIQADANSLVYGCYQAQVKGYASDLLVNANIHAQ